MKRRMMTQKKYEYFDYRFTCADPTFGQLQPLPYLTITLDYKRNYEMGE